MKKQEATVLINTVDEVQERLKTAIQSYKNQTGVKMQILVSTIKNDPAIVIAHEMGVECIVNPEKGIYKQLNNAMHYIKSDWWSFASGNDTAEPEKMINEINMCLNNNKKVCYSNFIQHYPDRKEVSFYSAEKFSPYSYMLHLTGNFVNDCSMQHVSLIEKYAPFRYEEFGNDSMWDFWLRVAEGEGEHVFIYNPERTWTYHIYDSSKHIVRQKNPEELQRYAEIRHKMLNTHIHKPDNYNPKNTVPFQVRCDVQLIKTIENARNFQKK